VLRKTLKLKPIHWILVIFTAFLLFVFVFVMTILIYKFLARPQRSQAHEGFRDSGSTRVVRCFV
jgi:heme/copper-type cytochrome/quinol oxidase subunit 2